MTDVRTQDGRTLTPEKRRAMLIATHDIAMGLRDDLAFLRQSLTEENPTRRDIRHSSVLIRRILLEEELKSIAAPRIKRVAIVSDDFTKVRKIIAALNVEIVAFGMAGVYGAPTTLYIGSQKSIDPWHMRQIRGERGKKTSVSLAQFLDEKSAKYYDNWIRRRDMINYVCYRMQGVHTIGRNEAVFNDIDVLKERVIITDEEDHAAVRMNDPGFSKTEDQLKAERNGISMPLLVLWRTIQLLMGSPDVIQLEKSLEVEWNDGIPPL